MFPKDTSISATITEYNLLLQVVTHLSNIQVGKVPSLLEGQETPTWFARLTRYSSPDYDILWAVHFFSRDLQYRI